jgi:hypothetical protein
MNTWGILTQVLLVILAALAGVGLARQGVVTGRAAPLVGAYDLTVLGRRVLFDVLQFRPNKVYFRLAVLPLTGDGGAVVSG